MKKVASCWLYSENCIVILLLIRQCSLKHIDFIASGGRIIGPDEFDKMWI